MLLMMGVTLYTSRVVLAALGVEDYGIYNVVGGVVAMFSILSRSLTGAISRFITFELGQGNIDKLKSVFSTSVTGDKEVASSYASTISSLFIMSIICAFIVIGLLKRINVYDSFIEGAKGGFKTAITIIPYLVAVLVAIGVFRASGAMDLVVNGISGALDYFGINSDFTAALPTMIMQPISGSGARGMMIDTMRTYGADSFVGRLSSVVQGSTDTTFYVVALYYGSVAIQRIRYTLTYSLIADLAGIITATVLAYIFW